MQFYYFTNYIIIILFIISNEVSFINLLFHTKISQISENKLNMVFSTCLKIQTKGAIFFEGQKSAVLEFPSSAFTSLQISLKFKMVQHIFCKFANFTWNDSMMNQHSISFHQILEFLNYVKIDDVMKLYKCASAFSFSPPLLSYI